MRGESGLTMGSRPEALDPGTVVVVLTGYGSIATAVESIQLGRRQLSDQGHGRGSDRGRVQRHPGE